MKIIIFFVAIISLVFQVHQSAQIIDRQDTKQKEMDFDNDANYNFESSKQHHSKERELYQILNTTPYQAPVLQSIPQVQQIPQQQWTLQQPQTYQINQQPIQYTPQPQTYQLQQQPIIETQNAQVMTNVQQQQIDSGTRLVSNDDQHQERVLKKMSNKNKNFHNLKIKLLKFVGKDRQHYFYQARHLAQYFCNNHYCSRNLNIYKDNNIKKKIGKKQDKRELCQNKCQQVVEQESQYQTKVVYKMKSSPQKMRVLTLFDTIFNDPHFCLNYANDPQNFRKQLCKKQKISEEKCGIVTAMSMQKACNTKKEIFNFHQALIQNEKNRKKDRSLKIDYSYKAFFKTSKPQCAQCRSRSLQYINQFYNYSQQKRLCSKRFKNDYEKKQACANGIQTQYDRKLQNVQGTCEKMCGNNSEQTKRKLQVIKNIPDYISKENQCASFCQSQSKKVCGNDEQCFSTFPVQCHSKCKFKVQKRQLYHQRVFVQTSQLINIYEYFQKVRQNYDKENEEQIRQMILYYNRDAIYDAILEMEKQIYDSEANKNGNMAKGDQKFEIEMQGKIEAYYKDQNKALEDLDNTLNIFDVELQFNLKILFNIINFIQKNIFLNIIRQIENVI